MLKNKRLNLTIPPPYSSRTKIQASVSATEIPSRWYNLVADLPVKPPPPLHPRTFQPINPEDLSPLFPDELIKQEGSHDRFIDIPDEVIDIYRLWRPTPLIRSDSTHAQYVLLHVILLITRKATLIVPLRAHLSGTSI